MAWPWRISGLKLVNRLAVSRDVVAIPDNRFSDGRRGLLDVYAPRGANGAPLAVFFYGGGWEDGAKEHYRFAAMALAQRGIVTMVPDYRLYPDVRFPDFISDGAKAVRWARRNAVEFGADPGLVFLIGHSIGGAITVSIAARQPSWPLLGIAVSGVGLVTPPASGEQWAALPDIPLIEMPPHLKDYVMFGPDWSFAPDAPDRSHAADAPCPRAELIDITSTWHGVVQPLAARVRVPLHYRQGEFDRLWITGPEQAAGFSAAFTQSPRVDGAPFDRAGHCIDFHRLGHAFQLEQLAFALNCCVPAGG